MWTFIQKNEEIIRFCVQNNTPAFNSIKANEEAVEFQEVLLKLQSKSLDNPKRPSIYDALDEYGDFIYRGYIKLKELFPNITDEDLQTSIEERINYKLGKLSEYHEQGRYKGGL